MNGITYYRPRKIGPESRVEDAVAAQPHRFAAKDGLSQWVGGSVPIGGGMPDLLFVSYDSALLRLSKFDQWNPYLLAHLKMSRSTNYEALTRVLKMSRKKVREQIQFFEAEQVIYSRSEHLFLNPTWSEILPEICSVEAKISDWQKAITQAHRNTIFAHRSYVAMPEKIADRIKKESIFKKLGIGLLAVDERNEVRMIRKARRKKPTVWSYYYKLAYLISVNQDN